MLRIDNSLCYHIFTEFGGVSVFSVLNTSGLSKTTTLIILFPGAFFRHTFHTIAPVKDVTYALKKNFLIISQPDLSTFNKRNELMSFAATETKPSYEIRDLLNPAMHILSLVLLCYYYVN